MALTFGNMAYDAILEGKTGLMSALTDGCYDLVPIPEAKLGPRKLDVASMYNTERYRPSYANKRGLADVSQPRLIGGRWKPDRRHGCCERPGMSVSRHHRSCHQRKSVD